ncbi:MAG: type II secretion system protein [Verrucomicrobia bacterium]|nr:type II secretion system protein [Verrucomicrobiota bacterium]
MNLFRPSHLRLRAFTLLEMTIVIMVMLALISTGLFVSGSIQTWQRGREASEVLRGVYTAQRLYLSDNPTTAVTSLTNALLIPYLANQATTMPTVKSLTGGTLNIKVTVFPPVVDNGSGVAYDPSGNPKDSLWDVGE